MIVDLAGLKDVMIGALSAAGLVGSAWLTLRQRGHEGKQTGEAALIAALQAETRRLSERDEMREDELQEMRGLVTQLYSGVWTLVGQLRAAGMEPAWKPSPPPTKP